MATAPIPTKDILALPTAAAIAPAMFTSVQAPGGPVQKVLLDTALTQGVAQLVGGGAGFKTQTLVQLNAAVGPFAEYAGASVHADGASNGIYSRIAAAWVRIGDLPDEFASAAADRADAAADAAGSKVAQSAKANLFPDHFFELSGNNRAYTNAGFAAYVPSMADGAWDAAIEHSYGVGGWSHTATAGLQGYAINFAMEPGLQAGVGVGDVISLAMLVKSSNSSQVISIGARFHSTSPTTYVGSQILFPAVAANRGEQVRKLENLTVPAGAQGITIYAFGAPPLATYHVLGLWAVRGALIGDAPPSKYSNAVLREKVIAVGALENVTTKFENAVVDGFVETFANHGYEAADAVYSAAGGGTQIAAQVADTRFNSVSVWGGMNGAGKLRGYIAEVATAQTHIPSATDILLFEKSVDWTTSATRRDEILDQIYTVPAGKELHLLWVSLAASNVTIARWTAAPDASVPKMRFSLTGAGDEAGIWSQTWYDGSAAFTTVPPILRLEGVAAGGGGGGVVAATVPEFIIPAVVNAVVGKEMNLYDDSIYSGLSKGPAGLQGYSVSVIGSPGASRERRYHVTPVVSQVGVHAMTARAFNDRNELVSIKSFSINILAATPLVTAKRILFIGDSLNATAQISTTLRNNFVALGGTVPEFAGTRGTAPNQHECRGGRRFVDYASAPVVSYRFTVSGVGSAALGSVFSVGGVNYTLTENNTSSGTGNMLFSGASLPAASDTLTKVSGSGDATIAYSAVVAESSNPFWNTGTGLLDIANYRSANGIGVIDNVIMLLGINGRVNEGFDADGEIAAEITAAKALATAFIANNALIKITIHLCAIGGNTDDGYGAVYGADYSRGFYEANIAKLRKAIIANFNLGVFHANVKIGAAGHGIDRYYGYGRVTGSVAARITGETQEYHINGVHPIQQGSDQIADMMFADCLAALS